MNPTCDLCKVRIAISPNKLLCRDCMDAVRRVMTICEWEAQRGTDVRRNAKQSEMLVAYLNVQLRKAVSN